jgi:hypothetical protein
MTFKATDEGWLGAYIPRRRSPGDDAKAFRERVGMKRLRSSMQRCDDFDVFRAVFERRALQR